MASAFDINRQDLKSVEKIGEGRFGSVYHMIWKKKSGDNVHVAVKRIFKVDDREFEALAKLKHPNIVNCFGVVREQLDFMVILEICEGGSLRSYLDKNGRKPLPPKLLTDWSRQAAKAIEYLQNVEIPHKDIQSKNYFISADNTLKLGNFGLAKSASKAIGIQVCAYTAPEDLKDDLLFPKCDVFAYAVVLWEMLTGQIPYEGMKLQAILKHVCQDNKRLEIPADCPAHLKKLLIQCWEKDLKERPSIDLILSILTSQMKSTDLAVTYICEFCKLSFETNEHLEQHVESCKSETGANATMASDRDFNDVTELLAPADLEKLFTALDLSHQDVEKERIAANTTDVNLQAKGILRFWRQVNGSKSTRNVIMKALEKCKNISALQKLQNRWGNKTAGSPQVSDDDEDDETPSIEDIIADDDDFNDVGEMLAPDDMQKLYCAIGLKDRDVKKAEESAKTANTDLKNLCVLRSWRRVEGSKATRNALIKGLEKCKNREAVENLEAKWKHKYPVYTLYYDVITEVAERLKRYYRSSYCKKQVYPWKPNYYVVLGNIYVPVTIDVEVPGARAIKKRLNSYLDILRSDEESSRYVLVGNPGQGKSTFCAKLAYDWSQSKDSPLKHIKLLFIIQLGLLHHKSSIEEAICSQLQPGISSLRLGKLIRDLGSSVAMVLDGLDEAPHDFLKQSENGSVVNTIKYNDMRECRVLVTTRPWRERDITRFPVYRRLELQKMTKSDIMEFVQKFFFQDSSDYMIVAWGKQLVRYIDANKLLVDASTPLMTLLISWYWIETKGKKAIPSRIHELYDNIIAIMHERSQHHVTGKDTVVEKLGQVAVKGLIPPKTQTVFTEDEIEQSCGEEILTQACAMGIMCSKKYEGEKALQFFHKSGQEFCTGLYLANHPDELSSYLEGVTTLESSLSVSLVLIFAASNSTAAKIIMKKLLGIFKAEIQPQIAKYYKELLPFDDSKQIQHFIELCLECNYEADVKAELTSTMKDLFKDGKVLFYGILPKAAISLAYYMAHCGPDTIRSITLRPIAHASDPFVFYGPTVEIYDTALRCITSLSKDEIQEIYDRFKDRQQNLHEDIQRMTPAEIAAYLQCIQAYEGLPSTSETNIVPIIDSLKHIKLRQLDLSDFKLGNNFNHLLESLENDHLKSMRILRVKSVTSTGQLITRFSKSLHKMPSLLLLDISGNKAEVGQSIPNLAENLTACKSLQVLYMTNMQASAEDMALLAQKLPSQLEALAIAGNQMNDSVASCLIPSMPRALTCLYISVLDISHEKHDELLLSLHPLTHLQDLDIRYSPCAVDLLNHLSSALPSWPNLETLHLFPTANQLIPSECMETFVKGIQQARSVNTLHLNGMRLDKEGFDRLIDVCKKKGIVELVLDRAGVPEGAYVDPLEDDFLNLL